MMSLLERAIKIETDSIACDARVFVSEGEDERSVVAEADPALADAQTALRLAEEDDIRRQRKLIVVL